MGLAPPNAGEVSIYGSQAGKDDAAGHLTQLIDGHTHSQTPHIRQIRLIRYEGTMECTATPVQHYYVRYAMEATEGEINESILRLFHPWRPIECDRSHTDALRGPRNTD